MLPETAIRAQLPHTLEALDLPRLGALHRGKVRDNYTLGDHLIMVTTDRISAFDHVLGTIPFKGEVLSRITRFWFEKVKDLAPTSLLDAPDPSVLVVRRAQPFPVEIVVRGYLTGSLWRDYVAGTADAYGIDWPAGLRKDQPFQAPVLTPSTKAALGTHDEPISEAEILRQGLVEPARWGEVKRLAFALFARGQAWARSRGLVLVDTKYEMGVLDGRVTILDEVHTPDSSRYWIAEGIEERFARGEDQRMLDKEFVRQWLIRERGFSGHGTPPALPDDVRVQLAQRYLDLYERLTGEAFASEVGDVGERIRRNLRAAGYLS